MEFHEHETLFQRRGRASALLPWQDYYQRFVSRNAKDSSCLIALAEARWYAQCRPYYNVWPAIVDPLLTVALDDFDCQHVSLPVDTLLVRFARGHEPSLENGGNLQVKSILVDQRGLNRSAIATLAMTLDGRCLLMCPRLRPGTSVATCISELSVAKGASLESAQKIAQLVCALSLLSHNDAALVERHVLASDRNDYQRTGDVKYVERAERRRGSRGWEVGRDFHHKVEQWQISVHFRRSHFRLCMTGPGRTIPRLKLIPPTIVHREKLTAVPTGYLDGQPMLDGANATV